MVRAVPLLPVRQRQELSAAAMVAVVQVLVLLVVAVERLARMVQARMVQLARAVISGRAPAAVLLTARREQQHRHKELAAGAMVDRRKTGLLAAQVARDRRQVAPRLAVLARMAQAVAGVVGLFRQRRILRWLVEMGATVLVGRRLLIAQSPVLVAVAAAGQVVVPHSLPVTAAMAAVTAAAVRAAGLRRPEQPILVLAAMVPTASSLSLIRPN